MGDNRDDVRNRDAQRGYFELFKHLNTISTVVLVIVLVLYRDLYLDPALALLSLAAFGVAVLASLCGILLAMNATFLPKRPSSAARCCGDFCTSPWSLWVARCSS